MDIDDVCFSVGLGEKLRARVEARGQVALNDDEAANLLLSKLVHVFLVVVIMVATVKGYHRGTTYIVLCSFLFWLGAMAETVLSCSHDLKGVVLRVTKSFGGMVLGLVLEIFLIIQTVG